MEPAGLLSLPVETLHHISQYLSVEDVLNLSTTCHYLRDAFNDNSVWKRFIPTSITHLKIAEQLVQPKFQYEDSLSPLCENRVHYLSKTHLLHNWESGNFVKHTSKVDHKYASGVFNVPKGKGKVIYNDKYIFLGRFINDIESDGIEVWDISGKPVLHSFLEIDKNLNYDGYYVIGSNLVVVDCRRVIVYQITVPEKTFPLLYSFIITESNVSWHEVVEQGRWGEHCYGWSYFNIGKYLVCNKRSDDGNVLHVWDIVHAAKYGAFTNPFEGVSVSLLSHDKDEWLFNDYYYSGAVNNHYCYTFDFKKRTFSNIVFEYQGYSHHTIFYKSYVLMFRNVETPNKEGFYDTCCTLYDYKTSREVKKRRFNNARKNYQLGSTTVVDGTFILLCFDCFHVVDALTLETVDHFQCDLDIRFVTHQFNVFGSIFVVACGGDYHLQLWDVRNKRKLKSLDVSYSSHLYPNESFSKMVICDYHRMNVLNFL